MATSANTIALHGWTAVPRSTSVLLAGKPYINKPEPLLVQDMPFPSDDPLVARIRDYAQEKLPPQTFNHSMRAYYFATAILTQQFPSHAATLSRSTLALACLLHDIGTTSAHLHATQLSFEFYGGYLALDLLLGGAGASDPASSARRSQAEAVAEAVIRHQDIAADNTTTLAGDAITLLGRLLQLATLHDNVGGGPELVHADTRRDVCARFPREGWSGCFAAVVREEVALKPWAHTTALGVEEFPAAVLGNGLMEEYE